ncbi:class I SAM-dependent methyltransferase [Bacillus sp. PS06]|uniref:class I SAM-dependent methyltransferase n=1 Tax=Bacillus sp. PS06 TaxID=2764176 RepID=UPI00177FF1A7|nr:class I SAM-dependent methyltransferase [Bacillus sp. PS06]MBD8068586.1 methyltransferase domain-containing protein [Bacillus sp. PS06]
MKLDRILPFARKLLESALSPGDMAVDATVGNGHDTLYLANLVGERGHVFGFDIQHAAIAQTNTKLSEQKLLSRVTLFEASHDKMSEVLPASVNQRIKAAIFNLGYLPGGDKGIVTKPDSTISAVEQLLTVMPSEGIIILVVYHGHEEGAYERDQLLSYVTTIDQQYAHVLNYRFMNQQNNPPFIIAIEKR